jgi:hypothetical protein
MANRTATLYIRIIKNGRSSFCKPIYQSKGRLKPQYAMVNGEPEHHKEGVYYVRFGADGGKQQYALVGKDPYVALDKLEEKKRWLRDRERQVVPQTPVNSKPETSKLSIDDAVERYFKNLHSQGKDQKTIRAYKVAVEEFRKSCSKKFLSEIDRQDLIDFMGWLRKQPPKLRKDGTPRKPRRSGDPNRTYFNKVNNVVIFLSAHGINRLLKKSEYPKFAEKPVVYYEAEQVKALYAAAKNDEERFTLNYFLKSGVRDGEAAHAEYDDVKSGFLNSWRRCTSSGIRSTGTSGVSRFRKTLSRQLPNARSIIPVASSSSQTVQGTQMNTCSASCSESQNVRVVHSTQTCTHFVGHTRHCSQAQRRFRPSSTCWVTRTSKPPCAISGSGI